MAVPEKAYSRKEMYYAGIAKGTEVPEKPYTREEMYLDGIKDTVDYIKEEVDKKSESIPLEYKNNKIYKDGVEIDFEGIKTLMGDHDNDIDLHADNSTIMRITAFADDAIEFSTTYITGGKVYVDRVIINSDNDIKFDEIETGGSGGGGADLIFSDPERMNQVRIGKDSKNTATATATYRIAIGTESQSGTDSGSGADQIAIGYKAKAVGTGSVVIGPSANDGYGYQYETVIGYKASGQNGDGVAIGRDTSVRKSCIAIGAYAKSDDYGQNYATAVGASSKAIHAGSVALGSYAKTSVKGEVNVGTTSATYGYDNTNYRLITGVHDPVNDHDAATKAYVDAHSGGGSSSYVRLTNDENTLLLDGNAVSFADVDALISSGKEVEIFGQFEMSHTVPVDGMILRLTAYVPGNVIIFSCPFLGTNEMTVVKLELNKDGSFTTTPIHFTAG